MLVKRSMKTSAGSSVALEDKVPAEEEDDNDGRVSPQNAANSNCISDESANPGQVDSNPA